MAAFKNFDEVLTRAAAHSPPEDIDFVNGLLLARGRLDDFVGILDANAFDPANDMFICMINQWMSAYPGKLEVIHDQSKPLKQSESFLRTLMQPATARMIGYGKRKAELPLRVSTFDFADSKNHPQLQLADIVAGAAVDCLLAWSGKRPCNQYHQRMKMSSLASFGFDGMLPSFNNIASKNPPGAGESSLVDGALAFMSEIHKVGNRQT